MTKSASDLVNDLAGIGEQIQKAAIAETRKYVAQAVEDQFLQVTGRKIYGGKGADEHIVEMLREAPLNEIPRLRQALEHFEDNDGEVSEDFRAGILFAVRLFADEMYDY